MTRMTFCGSLLLPEECRKTSLPQACLVVTWYSILSCLSNVSSGLGSWELIGVSFLHCVYDYRPDHLIYCFFPIECFLELLKQWVRSVDRFMLQ
eukprot:c31005_g1_i1 orf=161-442(-)